MPTACHDLDVVRYFGLQGLYGITSYTHIHTRVAKRNHTRTHTAASWTARICSKLTTMRMARSCGACCCTLRFLNGRDAAI